MKARANTVFSVVLVVGLAMLTFWLERLVREPGIGQPDQARHEPDFIVERVTAVTLDRAGRPSSTLTAETMRHFPDDETTELEEPRLVQLREARPPLHVAADRGTVFKEGNEVRLYGNVIVRREESTDRPELRMETTYLQVFTKEDVARTPERVFIYQGHSRLTGIGMDYDNKTRQLDLRTRVSGSFQREKEQ